MMDETIKRLRGIEFSEVMSQRLTDVYDMKMYPIRRLGDDYTRTWRVYWRDGKCSFLLVCKYDTGDFNEVSIGKKMQYAWARQNIDEGVPMFLLCGKGEVDNYVVPLRGVLMKANGESPLDQKPLCVDYCPGENYLLLNYSNFPTVAECVERKLFQMKNMKEAGYLKCTP